jgi:hypothetical protein
MRFYLLAALAALSVAACSDSGTGPTGGNNDVPDPPVDNRPPVSSIRFTTPSTFFQSLQSTVTAGGSRSRVFTLSESTRFVMRYASDYTAQFAIMPSNQLPAFEAFAAFDAFHTWNGGSGTQSLTLNPGTYAIGIRNSQSVSQKFSWELDLDILELPDGQGYSFSFGGVVFSEAQSISANGGWAWQSFSIQEGYRYFVDGTNTRTSAWIIPASARAAFEAGGSFEFFSDYEGKAGGAPGLWEVRLPPGTYYLAMRAQDPSVDGFINYVMERWLGQ